MNLLTPTQIVLLIAASLIDYLTHVAFFVTAWHEHNGMKVHYFLPLTKEGVRVPTRGMGLGKIRYGKQEKDIQVNSLNYHPPKDSTHLGNIHNRP